VTLLERLEREGIRRVGSPKSGFRYITASGQRLTGKAAERCRSLVLPPAWTDVRIAPSERFHLQAIGHDAAGRWQYRYHPAFRERQERKKYQRIISFAEALPKMRATVRRDLSRKGLARERVMACILRVLSTCFIRSGSEQYASENGSYGLATLRRKHVTVTGDRVHFSFRGKSGQPQERELKDRQVARVIRQLLDTPGVELFKFIADDGAVVDVKRQHINQYIKEVMGSHFSAKDFRTWAGTLIAACKLAKAAAADEDIGRKKQVVAAVKETAQVLGNTPAICRASYIYPSVLSSFEKGKTVERYFDSVEELAAHHGTGLHSSEKALVTMLRATDPTSASRPRSASPSARRAGSPRSGRRTASSRPVHRRAQPRHGPSRS
jgi:DNA topoisomerase I